MKNCGTHVTLLRSMYTTINTAFYHPNTVNVTRLPLVNYHGGMEAGYVNRMGPYTSSHLVLGHGSSLITHSR